MIGSDFSARMLEKGLSAASLRQNVLANNIANINTPGFKRSRVAFEAQLADALNQGSGADAVRPQVVVEDKSAARPDGNNVDLESEMSDLALNQIWYAALTRQLSDHFSRLSTVIHDGR